MRSGFWLFYWCSSGCSFIEEYVVISVVTILLSSAQFLKKPVVVEQVNNSCVSYRVGKHINLSQQTEARICPEKLEASLQQHLDFKGYFWIFSYNLDVIKLWWLKENREAVVVVKFLLVLWDGWYLKYCASLGFQIACVFYYWQNSVHVE